MGEEDLDELPAKRIQQAKRRLLQEIELEDGKISWMDGIKLDRSRALALCDEFMSDKQTQRYHRLVYRDKRLRDFLSRGELEHFLVGLEDSESAAIPFEQNWHGFGAWLSPFFCIQYNLVLGKALEQKELRLVECLLGGRRWVQPRQEEACFDHARRVIDRLIDDLSVVCDKYYETKLDLLQVQSELARGQLVVLLELMHNHVFEQASKTFHIIRNSSIDLNNKHDDPDMALALLETVAQLAAKYPQLRDNFDEDWRELHKIKAEQDKHSVKLTVGDKRLEITRAGARYGERVIRAEEVTSLRWGALLNAGGRTGMTQYTVVVGADQGAPSHIEWTTMQSEEQDAHFSKLTFASIVYLLDHCIANLQKRLDGGSRIPVGPAFATRYGLEVKVKTWFRSKDYVIGWADLQTDMGAGMITFTDRRNAKASATMSMKDTDNAIALYWMTSVKGKQ